MKKNYWKRKKKPVGRPPLHPLRVEEIYRLRDEKDWGCRRISKSLNCGVGTVHKYLRKRESINETGKNQ